MPAPAGLVARCAAATSVFCSQLCERGISIRFGFRLRFNVRRLTLPPTNTISAPPRFFLSILEAHLRLVQLVPYLFLPPGKVTNSTRARAASRSWLLVSVVRSECSWPLRRPDPVGSMLFGRRVGVIPVARRPSRRVPLTGLRRSPGHLQLPTSGKARCACCARRGRSGAPRGSPASLRRARPTRRFPH